MAHSNNAETIVALEGMVKYMREEKGGRKWCRTIRYEVHWLVLPLPAQDLEGTVGSIKGYTAHIINRLAGRNGHVWQRESYDRLVRDSSELVRTRTYISNNPTRAGAARSAPT